MSNFTPRTSEYYPKSLITYKTFTTYSWNHYAPEPEGNCTWFAFGETSRIVQECLGDENYNIQYASGNEFMSSGPSALYWISNATAKGVWDTYGSTSSSDPRNSAQYGNLINVQAGDILCYWATDGFGHVEVVEKVENGYVYCAGSKARVQQPAVFYYSRTVASSQFTVGRNHSFSGYDANGNLITWSGDYFQGVIRNPYVIDQPAPTPTETLEITISPASYSKVMYASEDFLDFPFTIQISGIPQGETVSGGNTYPGLSRIANTGWSYTDYVVNGVTYRSAFKTQTLRYYREHSYSYTTTKHMYFNITKSTGTINSDTPMYITVMRKLNTSALFGWLCGKKRKRGQINVI